LTLILGVATPGNAALSVRAARFLSYEHYSVAIVAKRLGPLVFVDEDEIPQSGQDTCDG
jgi:hypothetical protein